MTRSIKIIKQALENAAQELAILETELKSLDTLHYDKCEDALNGIRRAAERVQDETRELLLDLELGRFP